MANNYAPHPIPAPTPKDRARFMAKVKKNPYTGCWDWMGGKAPGGYGRFTITYQSLRAHRVSYAWTFGDTTAEIHHKCENPRCVNPDHLEAATEGQYRHRGPRPTHCSKGHKFEVTKAGRRICRICQRDKATRYREANRDKVLARRRETYQKIGHDPTPCRVCGNSFVPVRSTATMCPECRANQSNPVRKKYMRDYMRQLRAR